jgi:uncharacterized membrane protein
MPGKPKLVLAFFASESEADGAASALRAWPRSDETVHLDAIGILVRDESGELKTHKLGPYETAHGLGIGAVLGGVVAGLATGGLALAAGAVAGGAGGAMVGSVFRRGLGLSHEQQERVAAHLGAGGAAVGVLAPESQLAKVTAELESLGGEVDVHELPEHDAPADVTS